MQLTETPQQKYDFVIVGAGPAGLVAADYLSKSSKACSVLLLDKKLPWSEPVPCAEGVRKQGLKEAAPFYNDHWERQAVDGVIFVSPDGQKIEYRQPGSGIIINRALMHKDLAQACVKQGVHCNFDTKVLEIQGNENGRRTIRLQHPHRPLINARVVIDASGPGSGFANNEHMVRGNFDLEPAVFVHASGVSYPAKYIQLFFGQSYAPGGYGWLFPRGEGTANIGMVLGKKYVKDYSLNRLFNRFLKSEFPDVNIELKKGGAIACGSSKAPFACNNLYKAGDAASMVNPISRAGIVEAMRGGQLAAQSALQTYDMNDESCRVVYYKKYMQEWNRLFGDNHHRIQLAKNGFSNIPDKVFNCAARKIARIPVEKRTMGKIFARTLLSTPLVLWHMRGMFLGR
ncbi:MAG: NAD(P)/FAD-dependent oxidoreductase [Fibrobacteria bacterium]|nr:NAD(P)/FAD-dependent oxidoreductase [Fibrobacteria bacterium]